MESIVLHCIKLDVHYVNIANKYGIMQGFQTFSPLRQLEFSHSTLIIKFLSIQHFNCN